MLAMRTRLPVSGCVLLSAICLTSVAAAQTSWWRTYGGTGLDWGNSVQPTSDGGYVIAGTTDYDGAGGAYLVKTNASGDTQWTRTYGWSGEGCSVQQTSDGGYIVAGGVDGVDLIKTDALGDTLWTRTYQTFWSVGYSVQQTTDGGYIVAGSARSLESSVYLIKADASGSTLWTRTYGGTDLDWGNSVQQTSDSGYIIAGGTLSFGAGGSDVYLIKTDSSGDTLWTRTYGGASYEEGMSVCQTLDSGYIIAGGTSSFGAGAPDSTNVYLIKTNTSGDTQWTRTYGGTSDDEGNSVQQTADGGYIVAGSTGSFGAGDWDVYLIKTDASGDTLWTRPYGGVSLDEGCSVQQTSDSGYIIAGFTGSFGAGWYDVYLIKTDSLGDVGVAEESSKPQAVSRKPGATILAGASGVRHLAASVIYDGMGRRVLHPQPGIYFVREEPQTSSHKPPTVQKVLLVE